MSLVRSVLAIGLILVALSGSTARAEEAAEFAAAEEVEYVEYPEYVEPADSAEAPIEPVDEIAMTAAPVDEAAPAPVIEPTPLPALAPTVVVPSPAAMPAPAAAPAPAPASGKVAAALVDNRFQPGDLHITVGTTVTWTNNGFNFHTLSTQDAQFNSGALAGGQSFSYTFQQAGNFVLICRQHLLNGMTGRITVS